MAGPHSWLGNVGVAGTWDDASNWSTGLIPASGEDIRFDSNAANDVLTGPVAGKNEFGLIIVTSDFAKNMGALATTIALDAVAATEELIIDASSVPTYFKISGKFTRVTVLNAKKTATACVLSGTITELRITKGQIVAVTGSSISAIYVKYATSPSNDVNLTIPAGCTLTDIFQQGGLITNSSPVGGRLELDVGTFTHSAGAMGTLNSRGGTYNWNCANGIITKANLFGGTFDASGDPSPKVIVHMDLWEKATAYLNNGMQNITLQNPAGFYGGKMTLDKGSFFNINQSPTSSSPSASVSSSVSASVSASVSSSVSASTSTSASISSSVSTSVSASVSSSVSASTSKSASPSSTLSASVSSSPSVTPSASISSSPSASVSTSASISSSPSASTSTSASISSSPSASTSASSTLSASPSAS